MRYRIWSITSFGTSTNDEWYDTLEEAKEKVEFLRDCLPSMWEDEVSFGIEDENGKTIGD